jgi:capsule polysaccharide modification protein KpsS
MFNLSPVSTGIEMVIDTFQSYKRTLTNVVIKDHVLNRAANDFITSQTQFAKMLVNNTVVIAQHSVNCYSDLIFPKNEKSL